jgi:hypothetical protein
VQAGVADGERERDPEAAVVCQEVTDEQEPSEKLV